MKEENILVVRRPLLEQLGMFQGLCFDVDRYLPAFLARENNFFTARAAAELNPELKQIIPYVLLVHGERVLHYVRGKKAGQFGTSAVDRSVSNQWDLHSCLELTAFICLAFQIPWLKVTTADAISA